MDTNNLNFDDYNKDFYDDRISSEENLIAGAHVSKPPSITSAERFGLKILDVNESIKKRFTHISFEDLFFPFQYIEEVPEWKKSANWNESEQVIGRYEPTYIYANSGGQDISLNLKYNAETYDEPNTWSLKYIESLITRYKALTFPLNDGFFGPPPKLLLNIGANFYNVPVLVTDVSDKPMGNFDVRTALGKTREIQLQLKVSYPLRQSIGFGQVMNTTQHKGKIFAHIDNRQRSIR